MCALYRLIMCVSMSVCMCTLLDCFAPLERKAMKPITNNIDLICIFYFYIYEYGKYKKEKNCDIDEEQ